MIGTAVQMPPKVGKKKPKKSGDAGDGSAPSTAGAGEVPVPTPLGSLYYRALCRASVLTQEVVGRNRYSPAQAKNGRTWTSRQVSRLR